MRACVRATRLSCLLLKCRPVTDHLMWVRPFIEKVGSATETEKIVLWEMGGAHFLIICASDTDTPPFFLPNTQTLTLTLLHSHPSTRPTRMLTSYAKITLLCYCLWAFSTELGPKVYFRTKIKCTVTTGNSLQAPTSTSPFPVKFCF